VRGNWRFGESLTVTCVGDVGDERMGGKYSDEVVPLLVHVGEWKFSSVLF